jgi:ABC-type Mn2+/Zn2+ transport system ATPase subunit
MVLIMNAGLTLALKEVSVIRDNRTALEEVNVVFESGTSVALVGSNGSGKTTMLEVLAGLLAPTNGTVECRPDIVAMVTQHNPHRWSPLTVGEVVTMARYGAPLLPRRLTEEDHCAVADACNRMEVAELRERQLGELSGGQRQRVLIAQALTRRAPLLLLDEPITGLDLASQERILEVLEEETTRDVTVVLSTHHLDEARHCDRVLLLAGRLVADGSPDEVLRPDLLRRAFGERVLGDHASHDHAEELLLLDEHGHGEHG